MLGAIVPACHPRMGALAFINLGHPQSTVQRGGMEIIPLRQQFKLGLFWAYERSLLRIVFSRLRNYRRFRNSTTAFAQEESNDVATSLPLLVRLRKRRNPVGML